MSLKTLLAFLTLIIASQQTYADIHGKIKYVLNAHSAQDRFRVVIEPGWSGSGCNGQPASSQFHNSEITLDFYPSNNPAYESYQRNIAFANAALAANATVTLHANSNGCSGGYAITVFAPN